MRTGSTLTLATLLLLLLVVAQPSRAQCTSPSNEACAGATAFTFDQLPLDVSGVLGCTNDMVDRPYFDVFYRYDCTVSGEYQFDMCGSLGDTYMRIYIDGCGFGPASSWIEDDDGCGVGAAAIDPLITVTLEAGTSYWIELGAWREADFFPPNANDPYVFHVEFLGDPWTDQGCALAGVSGDPLLIGTGDLSAGSPNALTLSNAAPGAPAGLFTALSSSPIAFKGGTLKPFPFAIFPILLTTDGAGSIGLPFTMPAGVPAGTELWLQWAIQDGAAVNGVSLSNAVLGLTP